MAINVRPARQVDAQAIARLHYQMWRATYRRLAPESACRTLTEQVRLSRWQDMLALETRGRSILVAEVDGNLAGFGFAGAASHAIFQNRAEVKFLYVGTDYKRMGIGRILLVKLARDMVDFGYSGMALGVVIGNDPAIGFYEAMGGRRVGHYTDPGPIWRSENFVYVWDDLRALLALET
ncbi:GNAT family N-acetyltransferase [Microvirga sp. GCM10011540]